MSLNRAASDGKFKIAVDVDAKNLLCPMPLLRAKKAFLEIDSGEVLALHATDPGACDDVPAFARQVGHELLDIRQEGDTWTFFLRKA